MAAKERYRQILEDSGYFDKLFEKAGRGELAPHEFMIANYYAYGKPTETVKMEGQSRAVAKILLLRPSYDPLEAPEAPKRKLPALPSSQIPDEVGLTLEDLQTDD